MTNDEKFIQITKMITDAVKQSDILSGQEQEKLSAMQSQFGVDNVEDCQLLIEEKEQLVESLMAQKDEKMDALLEAYEWGF